MIKFEDFKKVSPIGWCNEMWEKKVQGGTYLLTRAELGREIWMINWKGNDGSRSGIKRNSLEAIIEAINTPEISIKLRQG